MRRSKRRHGFRVCRILWLGILLPGLLLPVSVRAAEGAPLDRVRDILERALHVLKDPALQGPELEGRRKREIRKLIAARFNYAEMAERSLNAHWATLTGKQRQDFVALFGELFERSYSRMVLDSLPKQRIIYKGQSVDGTKALVQTVLVDKRGDRLPVDYRLQRRTGQWELFDVVIDGVSIVTNYQSQFNRIIRTSSFDELVKKMRVKRAEE
ncbi:MAG: phospholipid-binding protein MlaC [Candidatus Methylomirabilales bacterium]